MKVFSLLISSVRLLVTTTCSKLSSLLPPKSNSLSDDLTPLTGLSPYDLVCTKEDYIQLLNGTASSKQGDPYRIGTIIGYASVVDHHIVKVKVLFFNTSAFDKPIIKVLDSSDLVLIHSALQEIPAKAKEMEDALLTESEDLIEGFDIDDDEIIH